MTRHLATVEDILCGTPHRRPSVQTATLGDVTCKRCVKRLDAMVIQEADAAFTRRHDAESLAACEAVGIVHLWHAADPSTSSGRMLRQMVGALARCFAEEQIESAARILAGVAAERLAEAS